MDIANQMILFAKVVESEGFSAAARDLGLTPSAVSRQIGHLEDHLGTRLLNRSTRKVSLTMVGTQFYKRCVEVDRNVTDAEALVLSLVDHPQGVMNVSSTSAFAKSQLMPLLPEFLELNPDLKISLELSDRAIDLVEDQIDVAIRFTEQVNDISVVAHKLAANQRVFCASPAYIEAHGMPMSPVELSQHNCLRLSTLDAFNTWDLGDSDHKRLQLINGNFEINSTDGLYHAALSGLGIARLSTYLVNNAVREGKLVHVLPDHIENDSSILAIFSNKKNLSPNVRAFVDFLARKFGPTPPWDKV